MYGGHIIHYDLVAGITADHCVPLLLLGGVLQNRKSWTGYVKDISPANATLALDLPGIGDGGILAASHGFDFLADCINELLNHLNIPRVHIFATSYSSVIAYEFSARYTDRVGQLVISSSMASLPARQRSVMRACISSLEHQDLEQFYNVFVAGVCHPERSVHNYDLSRKVIRKLIALLTPVEIAQFIENTKRILKYPEPILSTPIHLSPLVFTGAFDIFTPPSLCRNIGRLYQNSYFGTLDHYDHLFHIGNRRAIIRNLLPFYFEGKVPGFAIEEAAGDSDS